MTIKHFAASHFQSCYSQVNLWLAPHHFKLLSAFPFVSANIVVHGPKYSLQNCHIVKSSPWSQQLDMWSWQVLLFFCFCFSVHLKYTELVDCSNNPSPHHAEHHGPSVDFPPGCFLFWPCYFSLPLMIHTIPYDVLCQSLTSFITPLNLYVCPPSPLLPFFPSVFLSSLAF